MSSSNSRSSIAFDDDHDDHDDGGDNNGNNNSLFLSPFESDHWKKLGVQEGDGMIENVDELKKRFQSDITNKNDNKGEGERIITIDDNNNNNSSNIDEGKVLALWSCIVGYCEAISTHKGKPAL